MPKLVRLDWNEFKRKNKDTRQAFESLCYFLFCREYGQSNGIFGYKNQTGIEKEPIHSKKKWIGFQSKFFDHKVDWSDLKGSIQNGKSKNPNLQIIRLYLNQEFAESTKQGIKKSQEQINLEKIARDLSIKIEWFGPGQFDVALNTPSNLDIAQLFFGSSDEFGFIKNGTDQQIQTFLQSKEYLQLPLTKDDQIVNDVAKSILRNKKKCFLIAGHPGSGKSIVLHSLFRQFGGLNKPTIEQMKRLLEHNKAVPMIINLKDCVNENIESLIRARQNDSEVRGKELGFIYLFDGLDELNDERADHVAAFIRRLEQQDNTRKIIISCRSGNLNRLKIRAYINQIIEFQFCNLESKYLDEFFARKENKSKQKSLKQLRLINPKVLDCAQDILLIRLVWETIENLGVNSTIADLVEQKVLLLLNDPSHKKNIDGLNLLDTKADELIAVNQEISFSFQQKFQYRFSIKELQSILLSKFPRLDYRSINDVLTYLGNLFFENSYLGGDPDSGSGPGFIYQHRRYQEFFFTQKLKGKYEEDPTILRKLDVLSNLEFFEGYFLPYLRKDYEQKEDVVGLLDINLIDLYLGNHRGYGVDDAYYLNSPEFIRALACQREYLVDELLDSENFQIGKILFVDLIALKNKFSDWRKDKNNDRANRYISSIWSEGVASLLEHIEIFWKAKNFTIARELQNNLDDVTQLFANEKYLEQIEDQYRPNDPFWKQWENYLFLRMVINKEKGVQIFNDLIRANYNNLSDDSDSISRKNEDGRNKLVKSFFRIILQNQPNSILGLMNQLNDFELSSLLDVLSSGAALKNFLTNSRLQKIIKLILVDKDLRVKEKNFHIGFYKKLLGISLSEDEIGLLNSELVRLRKERQVDWGYRDTARNYAMIAFALGVENFTSLIDDETSHIRYYDELALYSALFSSLINCLQDDRALEEVLRDFVSYVSSHEDRLGHYLKTTTSFLWSEIFDAFDALPTQQLLILKKRLLQDDTNVVAFSFAYHLSNLNKPLFDKLFNETDLSNFEKALTSAEDYQSLVNECFSLAIFYSDINQEKSRLYFIKGLKESVVRHGWRKDSLVSYQLVSALEIFWKNNWESEEVLHRLTHEVFKLTLRVAEFTDGKNTWEGPFNVIELVSKFDVKFASELKDILRKERGYSRGINKAVTSVLLGKVRLGISLEDIEAGMSEYHKDYDYESKPNADYFEQKFIIYLSLAESGLYYPEVRKVAFKKAYDLIELMKAEEVSYYLNETYFRDHKIRYLKLCKSFDLTPNVVLDDKKDSYIPPDHLPEKEIIKKIIATNTPRKISQLYKQIQNYKKGLVLTQRRTWEVLLNQTFKVLGNIQPFIRLLEESSFPHTDFYTENSKNFHIGLAVALSDLNMKPEALKLLCKNTGHGGFKNTMKAYELIGDKEMCRKLFTRYLQLCHLLSS